MIYRVHYTITKYGNSVPSLILIGARAERTNKYILALAAGVPCVHYNWLYQCRHDVSDFASMQREYSN